MLVFEVYHPTKLKCGHSHLRWQCHCLVTLPFHCQRRRRGSACVLIANLGGSLQIDQQCISLITDTITRSIKHSYPCHDWWTSNHLLARSTVMRFTLRRIGNIQNSLALTKKTYESHLCCVSILSPPERHLRRQVVIVNGWRFGL